MKILGISLGHDSSFAMISDGHVVGMMEAERYFRKKRYKLHCLSLASGKHPSGYQYVDVSDLQFFIQEAIKYWGNAYDAIAVQNQGRTDELENLKVLLAQTGITYKTIQSIDHHLAHAALAFYTSPFKESLILSYDGFGNDGHTLIFQASSSGIDYKEKNEIRFGQCYNNLGYIIGISPDISGSTAGKAMGLGSYGKVRESWLPYAHKYVREYQKLKHREFSGLNEFGKGHQVNSVGLIEIPELRGFAVKKARERFLSRCKLLLNREDAASAHSQELRLSGPDDALSHDLMATVQHAWTEEVLKILDGHRSKSRNLCVVGGCALNGITNYAIQEKRWFDQTYFIPHPSDCGLSAGAALKLYYEVTKKQFNGYGGYFSPYLGVPPFDIDEAARYKQEFPYREIPEQEVSKVVSRLIFSDRIVGVIRGRYEVGPRALGNRSILCNPLNKNMRDILNFKVKHREWYRPFAPVVTAEDSHKYFTNSAEIPYMSVICYTKPEYRQQLPSVTHVDGSARLQTVSRQQNPFLHQLLKDFEKHSGVPILLNTSFNPKGEPILNFCSVGLEMLNTTKLDCVLIENILFCKPGNEDLLK